MYKCEIVTDVERHQVDLDGFESLDKAYSYVLNTLNYTGDGGKATFRGPTAILVLDLNNSVVKSWRVWYVDPNPLNLPWFAKNEPAAPIEQLGEDMPPWDWAGKVDYLGQKLAVKGLTYNYFGKVYLMPLTINDLHPYKALSVTNALDVHQLLKVKYAVHHVIAIPSVELSDAEAVAYMYDCVKELNPDPVKPGEITGRSAGMLWEK